jgi:hypothetical protein
MTFSLRLWLVSLIAFGLVLTACKGTEVHTIELTLASSQRHITLKPKLNGDPGGNVAYTSYAGFGCADAQDKDETPHLPNLLTARAYKFALGKHSIDAQLHATVVVDTIRIDGYPRCRATEIYNFCSTRKCAPIESERRCFDLPTTTVPLSGDRVQVVQKALEAFSDYLKEGLKDALVTDQALDEEVIIRLVGTTETCDELEARGSLAFDPTKLLGCSYSCPIVPTAVHGEVLLDLDALTQRLCEPAVRACAADSFSPDTQGETVEISGFD